MGVIIVHRIRLIVIEMFGQLQLLHAHPLFVIGPISLCYLQAGKEFCTVLDNTRYLCGHASPVDLYSDGQRYVYSDRQRNAYFGVSLPRKPPVSLP